MERMTLDELQAELGTVTSRADARAVLNRAARVAGVGTDRPLAMEELLLVLEALAAEGGMVQQLAETIARDMARPNSAA